jgi:hypothetical protein
MLLHLTKGLLLPSTTCNDNEERGRMVLNAGFAFDKYHAGVASSELAISGFGHDYLADIKSLRMTECLHTYGLETA